MYGHCKKCNEDVSDLMDWDSLSFDYIECPKCGHKMKVEFDDGWDGEDENHTWWLEDYKE